MRDDTTHVYGKTLKRLQDNELFLNKKYFTATAKKTVNTVKKNFLSREDAWMSADANHLRVDVAPGYEWAEKDNNENYATRPVGSDAEVPFV